MRHRESESVKLSHKKYDAARREHRAKERIEERDEKFRAMRFVAWDGEGSEVPDGEPQPYMLFGNSDGLSIQARQLSTIACLDLICKADPDVINFGFAFDYDANQIVWEIGRRKLHLLNEGKTILYENYWIQWIRGKWLRVKRNAPNSRWIKIYDVFHYFNTSLVKVLNAYEIGTIEEREYITRMKEERPQFRWEEIQEVKKYWRLEGQLMVQLMEFVRDAFADAGLYISSWHGPGAVARYMMRTHNVKAAQKSLRESNPEVWIAARYAFSAGRFEQFRGGHYIGDVWNYDIHSAYPYAIQFLPDLNSGHWVHSRNVDRNRIRADRFCLYQIRYRSPRGKGDLENFRPHPLFRRLRNDNICWPDRVNGWYWSPEAELVKDDPNATFVESWEFQDDGSRPLSWIAEIYHTREYHKRLGNPVELGFKLGMNSCYGQFAQRAGWESVRNVDGSRGGPPAFHQLEWAGYITSMCKAMVFRVANWAYERGGLVTIDTDGIFSTVRIPESVLPNGIGPSLGQWEEKHFDEMLIIQNGFYWLKQSGAWKTPKTRGAPRGTVQIEKGWELLDLVESGQHNASIATQKHMFVGIGKARQGSWWTWRSWQTIDVDIVFGGSGKRQHDNRCAKCQTYGLKRPGWDSQLHFTNPVPPGLDKLGSDDYWSLKHRLPWLEKAKAPEEEFFFDEKRDEIFEEVTL